MPFPRRIPFGSKTSHLKVQNPIWFFLGDALSHYHKLVTPNPFLKGLIRTTVLVRTEKMDKSLPVWERGNQQVLCHFLWTLGSSYFSYCHGKTPFKTALKRKNLFNSHFEGTQSIMVERQVTILELSNFSHLGGQETGRTQAVGLVHKTWSLPSSDSLFSYKASPSKGSTAFPNSATSWGTSVQTHKPMGNIPDTKCMSSFCLLSLDPDLRHG